MMTEPPKSEGSEEICPICDKPKSGHTPNEVLVCTKKMRDLQDSKDDKMETS